MHFSQHSDCFCIIHHHVDLKFNGVLNVCYVQGDSVKYFLEDMDRIGQSVSRSESFTVDVYVNIVSCYTKISVTDSYNAYDKYP